MVFCPSPNLLYALSFIINDVSCLAAEQNGGRTSHQRVVLDHIRLTLVPPSSEPTATHVIYMLNRMLNIGCVPNSADQWRTNGQWNRQISPSAGAWGSTRTPQTDFLEGLHAPHFWPGDPKVKKPSFWRGFVLWRCIQEFQQLLKIECHVLDRRFLKAWTLDGEELDNAARKQGDI